ncbi:unnamed protein product [Discosporangium mesarthrocarpum]
MHPIYVRFSLTLTVMFALGLLFCVFLSHTRRRGALTSICAPGLLETCSRAQTRCLRRFVSSSPRLSLAGWHGTAGQPCTPRRSEALAMPCATLLHASGL